MIALTGSGYKPEFIQIRSRIPGLENSIAVATKSRSMVFVTIVNCVRWCVCVCLTHIFWRQSTPFGVCLTYQPRFEKKRKRTQFHDMFSFLKVNQ